MGSVLTRGLGKLFGARLRWRRHWPAGGEIEYDAGGALTRRVAADFHDGVEAVENLGLTPPFECIAEQRRQGTRQVFRRAGLLQKFWHESLARHQVGQDHG